MKTKYTPLYSFFIGGVFLYIDQWLKWQSLHTWDTPYLLGKWFGWYPFLNQGVAFGLPVPMTLVVLCTLPLLFGITFAIVKWWKEATSLAFFRASASMFVLLGALSNFIDRIVLDHTIDYIRIFSGVINVADLLIVFGFILLFFTPKEKDTSV